MTPHLAPHTGYVQIQEKFPCRSGLDWFSDYILIMMQCLGNTVSKAIQNYMESLNVTTKFLCLFYNDDPLWPFTKFCCAHFGKAFCDILYGPIVIDSDSKSIFKTNCHFWSNLYKMKIVKAPVLYTIKAPNFGHMLIIMPFEWRVRCLKVTS